MNNFIVYNTHLQAWNIYAFGPEKQDGYTACHHHHQGQSRPHQKTITHLHTTPQAFTKDHQFLGGGEGVIHSPLPHHKSKHVELEELLLLEPCKMNQGAKKKNKTNMIKWTSLRLTPINFGI